MNPTRSIFTIAVDVWSWPEILREVERRIISFGVKKKSVDSRWRGLSVELRVEVEGSAAALSGFSRYIASLSA
jgi:hypothetical protein